MDDYHESDDDLADEESGKNHDPKTGKRTKPHPFDPEDDHLQERWCALLFEPLPPLPP